MEMTAMPNNPKKINPAPQTFLLCALLAGASCLGCCAKGVKALGTNFSEASKALLEAETPEDRKNRLKGEHSLGLVPVRAETRTSGRSIPLESIYYLEPSQPEAPSRNHAPEWTSLRPRRGAWCFSRWPGLAMSLKEETAFCLHSTNHHSSLPVSITVRHSGGTCEAIVSMPLVHCLLNV